MSRPIHCPKCQAERGVAIPKLCLHRSAAELIADIMWAENNAAQLNVATNAVKYIEDLQDEIRILMANKLTEKVKPQKIKCMVCGNRIHTIFTTAAKWKS